ncbi:hypothetical protein [Thermoflavimicrobium daqui]|jgi:hypothetical protein|uniref:hypothetical protein n=1 Tax=Thermoflavimicrobium daqui TaxID=2137476 RepID=UPI00143DC784|nr:hypothetical protein [Thermoflavimicrobium daqui]
MGEKAKQPFQLLNVKEHPDALKMITEFERELNDAVKGNVALVAYIDKEQKS